MKQKSKIILAIIVVISLIAVSNLGWIITSDENFTKEVKTK